MTKTVEFKFDIGDEVYYFNHIDCTIHKVIVTGINKHTIKSGKHYYEGFYKGELDSYINFINHENSDKDLSKVKTIGCQYIEEDRIQRILKINQENIEINERAEDKVLSLKNSLEEPCGDRECLK